MSTGRKLVISTVIVGLIVGHAIPLVRGREHWPFSNYPMFSSISGPEFSELRLVGVVDEDGEEIELPAGTYLTPFDAPGFRASLPGALARHGDDPEAQEELLGDLLELYDLRSAGHGGPRLRGLRVYRYAWALDPRGEVQARPSAREFILDYDREGRVSR